MGAVAASNFARITFRIITCFQPTLPRTQGSFGRLKAAAMTPCRASPPA